MGGNREHSRSNNITGIMGQGARGRKCCQLRKAFPRWRHQTIKRFNVLSRLWVQDEK